MTIEQAKSELMQIYGALSPDKQRAIDTLVKIEPCEDAISRQAVLDGIDELKKSPWATDKRGFGFEYLIKEALEVVADLCVKQEPSVNPQEPSGDMVSRGVFEQVKWERDVAINQLKELGYGLGEQIRTDSYAISRQAVLDNIDAEAWEYADYINEHIGGNMDTHINIFADNIRERVNELPPVTPQPKMGHWTHDGSHWKNRFICSECNNKLYDEPTNYCPNCGCRMVEPQESEDKE